MRRQLYSIRTLWTITSSNQYISASKNYDLNGFLDENAWTNTKICIFTKFPGISMGIWRKPSSREKAIPGGPALDVDFLDFASKNISKPHFL